MNVIDIWEFHEDFEDFEDFEAFGAFLVPILTELGVSVTPPVVSEVHATIEG